MGGGVHPIFLGCILMLNLIFDWISKNCPGQLIYTQVQTMINDNTGNIIEGGILLVSRFI